MKSQSYVFPKNKQAIKQTNKKPKCKAAAQSLEQTANGHG